MKCKICKGKTTWDTSYGRRNFLVCQECFSNLTNKASGSVTILILETIKNIGYLMEEKNKNK